MASSVEPEARGHCQVAGPRRGAPQRHHANRYCANIGGPRAANEQAHDLHPGIPQRLLPRDTARTSGLLVEACLQRKDRCVVAVGVCHGAKCSAGKTAGVSIVFLNLLREHGSALRNIVSATLHSRRYGLAKPVIPFILKLSRHASGCNNRRFAAGAFVHRWRLHPMPGSVARSLETFRLAKSFGAGACEKMPMPG